MRKLTITNTHGFTAESLLKEEQKMKDVFLKQRVTAVRLVMEGYQAIEIAQIVGICRQSVSTYVKLFQEGGLSTLLHRDFPPGNRPLLSPHEQEEVKHVMQESTPAREGIEPVESWDTRLLQKWIERRFSITMSRPGIRDMLIRMGFRWKRTTYVLAKANPEKQQAFLHQLETIKKT